MAENTEKIETKVEKKNVVWTYSLVDHVLRVVFPSGTSRIFNLSQRVNGMAASDELMYQYGVKQWMSSNAASKKEEEEKIESFKTDFDEFIKNGLELSEGGTKISVVGRERANAGQGSETRKLQKEVANTAISMVELTQKLMAGTITEEEKAKLSELMSTAQKYGDKLKK